MNFRRSTFLFILISLFSGGGLFLTKNYGAIPECHLGEPLFPLPPNAVTSIAWHVSTLEGIMPVKVKRLGQRWSFVSPFPESDCDERTIQTILDAATSMDVTSLQGKIEETGFMPTRELILATADQHYAISFGNDQPFANDSTVVARGDNLVTIDSKNVARLPRTLNEFRTKSLLAFIRPEQILSLEWHVRGAPFTRIHRLANSNNWTLSQPFTLTLARDKIQRLLEALTKPNLIETYLTPDDFSIVTTPTQFTSTELMQYDLDEEHAIRLSVYVRGLKEPLKLRFGKNDPIRENHVFCLMSNNQAIVSVPREIRDALTNNENAIINASDIPIIADIKKPTTIRLRQKEDHLHTTYVLDRDQWKQQAYDCYADPNAMEAFCSTLLNLRGDLINTNVVPTLKPECEIIIEQANHQPQNVHLTLYRNPTTQQIEVFREDNRYSYALKNENLLSQIMAENVTYALLNQQLLQLPPETIKTITIQRTGLPNTVISRNTTENTWQTISPAGAFVNEEVADQWLKQFENLRATQILGPAENPSAPWGSDNVGNLNFSIRVILDLKDDTHGLRKVLLFETPNPSKSTVQMMILGSPILYEVPRSVYDLLATSPLLYLDR